MFDFCYFENARCFGGISKLRQTNSRIFISKIKILHDENTSIKAFFSQDIYAAFVFKTNI